jgi:hypothetical protein
MTTEDLKIGRAYRAKRPRPGSPVGLVNDRQIKWLGATSVQYDSPSVGMGRRFPEISIEAFLKWASHDVTDELPEGEWQTWSAYRRARAGGSASD